MEIVSPDSSGFVPHVEMASALFVDRLDAGRRLAARVAREAAPGTVVIALSHGGVEVAAEVARTLGAPLDMLAVRKIRYPGAPERVLGAVAPGYATYVHNRADLSHRRLAIAAADARAELEHVDSRLHGTRHALDVRGRNVLLVDDGITTGARMVTAIRWARTERARRIVVAVPLASAEAVERVREEADHFVSLYELTSLGAVGIWYEEFEPLTDEDVLNILEQADHELALSDRHHRFHLPHRSAV